ncbi:MAG: hypothetical protein O3C57_02720, partial [Verrucomicrobia bacterium]|nr:hypothetical protein [Verrucomicrobiota bacterium]
PYSKDEIVFDYLRSGMGGKGYTRVMLAIAQRSVLRSRYSLLEEAGGQVTRMSISTEGILNWYCVTQKAGRRGEGTLILDVDSGFSDLVVVESNRLLSSRSVLIGAARIQADAKGAAERLGKEVRNTLSALAAEVHDVQVQKIVVSGAACALPGFADALAEQLGMPVKTLDALDALPDATPRDKLRADENRLVSMTAVIGMALSPQTLDIDLVPESVQMRRDLVLKARGLSTFGALVMVLMMLMSSYGISKVLLREGKLRQLRHAVALDTDRANLLNDKMAIVELVHDRVRVDNSAISVINDIHSRVPNLVDVNFKAFSFDADAAKVQLAGTGRTTRDIRALVKALELSPRLSSVQEGQTKFNKKTERYDFTLQCFVEKSDAG